MAALPWLLASYLLGAVPTSYLAGRLFRGIDLREHGSRNLGATNLYRVLGWRFAVPVGLFDAAKGLVPVLVFAPRVVLVGAVRAGLRADGGARARLLGVRRLQGREGRRHRGGRHARADAGGARRRGGGVGVLVYLTGYVSRRQHRRGGGVSGGGVADRPARRGAEMLWLDVAVAAAIIWLHRANIQRLLKGTENRFGRRAAARAVASRERRRGARRRSWGTTLANLLAAKGEAVRLWAYEPEVVESINRTHENAMFLPGVRLGDGVRAFADRAGGGARRRRSSSARRRATRRAPW